MTGPTAPAPLNADPLRIRAIVEQARPGHITWACPLCEHQAPVDPGRRLEWVLSRARYHLRWVHGYMPIPGWTPPGARRVTADELQRRTAVPRRLRPGLVLLVRPDGVPVEYLAA